MTARGSGCWRHGPALVWLRLWARGVALPCGSSVDGAAWRPPGAVGRFCSRGVPAPALRFVAGVPHSRLSCSRGAPPGRRPIPTIIYICIGVVNSALRGTLGPCPVAADGCFGGRCPAFCRYCRASGIQAWHKNSAPVATRAPAHCWFSGLAGGGPLPPPSAFIQAARHRACRWPRWRG